MNYDSSDSKENCNSEKFSPEIIFEKDYTRELLKCKNEIDLIDSLKKKNIKITKSEAKFILDQVKKYIENASSKDVNYRKIPDQCLQDVSGGRKKDLWDYFLFPIYASGYVMGAAPMVGVALYNMLQGAYDQLRGE